ncbi:MAG: hypothetical protein JO189_01830 [Deltaproteobacteria bacterium]|nr:hypothetical protein [Deltaproteobacteria bacterium]
MTYISDVLKVWEIRSAKHYKGVEEIRTLAEKLQIDDIVAQLNGSDATTESEIQIGSNLRKLRAVIKNFPDPSLVSQAIDETVCDKIQTYLEQNDVRGLVWKVRKTPFELPPEAKFYNTYSIPKSKAGEDLYRAFRARLEVDVDRLHEQHRTDEQRR